MRLQSLQRPLLATGEWRGDSLASLFPLSSLLLPPTPHSCFVVLRLRANKHRESRVYVCACVRTDFTCTVSTWRSRAREREGKREREIERKGSTDTYLCGYVRAERGPKIKHEKSIVEEKRGDVFRPNYVPPLAACCCRGCCGNGTAGRQGPAQLTKGADANDSKRFEFAGVPWRRTRGNVDLGPKVVGRTMVEV